MLGTLYSTDLSDAAWRLMARLLPAARAGGRPRPRTTDVRAVLTAIFYMLRTGRQWRLLPRVIGVKCFFVRGQLFNPFVLKEDNRSRDSARAASGDCLHESIRCGAPCITI